MRGDYKSRMEGYAIGRQNGWMSANDIRELENLNPIPDDEGGSQYLVNGNMIPIGLAGINLAVSAMQTAQESEQTESQEQPREEPPPKKRQKKKQTKEGDEADADYAGKPV